MNAMIVYDSVFGNTKLIAEALVKSLEEASYEVGIFSSKDAPQAIAQGVKLAAFGSPTRAFRPTADILSYLKALPDGSFTGCGVLAFDTRIYLPSISSRIFRWFIHRMGYAAPVLARQLEKKGAHLLLPPEGFNVEGKEGPLRDGEVQRVNQWIKGISP